MKLKKDKSDKKKKKEPKKSKETQENAQPEYQEINAWLAAPEQGIQGIIFQFEGGYYRVLSADKYA